MALAVEPPSVIDTPCVAGVEKDQQEIPPGHDRREVKREAFMQYEAPQTLEAASALLAGAGGVARVLAGGTDLLVQMRGEFVDPDLIVDIKNIPEMRSITLEDGRYRVGAAVPGIEIMEHEGFNATWPGVVDGVGLIGSIQIRGRATMGGNLCNASPAADSVPAMIAAGAVASVVGPNGRRDVPVEEIAIGPGKTSLEKGEIVASFLFPERTARSGGAYLRFIPRTEMDIAVVGVGVDLTLDESGVCTRAKVALGAVAERPLVVEDGAAALVGTKIDDHALENLAAAASAACRPIDDKRGTIEFRTDVAGVFAKRAALKAVERARQN
jgi:CO/xanthine dehydrogenase FAD-binding subunit